MPILTENAHRPFALATLGAALLLCSGCAGSLGSSAAGSVFGAMGKDTSAGNAATAPTPAVAVPAAPQSGATVQTAYTGKRFAIDMLANCPKDPDPTGLVNNDSYFKCGPAKLGAIRNWIGQALTARYGVSAITEDSPDYILTVTLTQDMVDKGTASSGIVNFLVPDAVVMSASFTLHLAAAYELADPQGHVIARGTVHLERHNMTAKKQFGQAEQAFAESIAADVSGAKASGN